MKQHTKPWIQIKVFFILKFCFWTNFGGLMSEFQPLVDDLAGLIFESNGFEALEISFASYKKLPLFFVGGKKKEKSP